MSEVLQRFSTLEDIEVTIVVNGDQQTSWRT
jgi:hypothetical protein